MKSSWIVTLAVATALTSCTKTCQRGESSVVEIGSLPITRTDIELRDKVMAIYYPENKQSVGLRQLINAYLLAEVLKNNGHAIDSSVIDKEAERIEKSTQMPDMLTRIQAVFGKDTDAYKRVFVLPTYAERTIYFGFFLQNKSIHAESLRVAEGFLREAREKAKKFAELAKEKGMTSSTFTVSLRSGIEWERPAEEKGTTPEGGAPPAQNMPMGLSKKMAQQKDERQNTEGKRWIQEIVNNLKVGEVHRQVIDLQEQWQVVRYVGPVKGKEDTYRFESIFFPKADYAKWLDAEKLKVPIDVHDKKALEGIPLPGDTP